ncbi:hypothetical protein K2173_014832 [Erythroxylum novogranatense]|uniref:RING-type domain-containing protein n=1 Tax=Erythroxylum novogranatense TaxID=1862640 RepID=A0AAV8THI4_9ROSI|nr:hypothetical protein K2173_014832 [Erythroxylum novogranatense]
MAAFSEFLSRLLTMTLLFFTLLFLELAKLCRSVTKYSDKRIITDTQYVNLIEQKYPTVCFSRHQHRPASECAVCLSEFHEGESVRGLRCGHVFHKDCLDKWLQQGFATCPLCRTQVLSDEVVRGYRRQRNPTLLDDSEEETMYVFSALLHTNGLHGMF